MNTLKIGTLEDMHKQLNLPEGRYGIVVDAINVRSVFNPDQMPTFLYKSIEAGKVEIHNIRYADINDDIIDCDIDSVDFEVMAYEIDNTSLLANTELIAVPDYTPYILMVITNDSNLSNYKMDIIELVDIGGVLKATLLVRPLLPVATDDCDYIDTLLFKLSYIPYVEYINRNYLIAYDKNSLNSILSTYVLLSNRHSMTDIKLIDINDDIADDFDRTYIVIDTEGNVSIDNNASVNILDAISNMCRVFNIQFLPTDLMTEIDSINRKVDGYSDITKILLEVISTDTGKAGFIENTIPLVSSGMYKTFTNFFSGELMELTIRKRIAKEILDIAQVAHSDFYTVTIIDSNILLDELVECICINELENPIEDHIYVINTSHTNYSTMAYFNFNNPSILDLFVTNLEYDFDVITDDYIDDSSLFTNNIDTINTLLLSHTINTNTVYNIGSRVLKPRYCKIEKSL